MRECARVFVAVHVYVGMVVCVCVLPRATVCGAPAGRRNVEKEMQQDQLAGVPGHVSPLG